METLRLLRWGPLITLFVICGTTVSSAHADEKSAVDNAKARVDAARKVYQGLIETLKNPEPNPGRRGLQYFSLDPEKFYLWSRRWMDAQIEMSDKKAAIEAHLERMKELEKLLSVAGREALYSVHGAEFYRLEAEKWLSEAKTK